MLVLKVSHLFLQMETFFKDYSDAGAGKAARSQALAHVRKNIKWLSQHKEILEGWLDAV
jgi:hypothetical protein